MVGSLVVVASSDAAAHHRTAAVPSYTPEDPMPVDAVAPQAYIDALGISGYPDKLSVRPGEKVRIMVSTQAKAFTAQMVRVRHGDNDPAGPGLKEDVVPSPVNGTYQGRYQPLPLGSYVKVPDHQALRPSGSFTITAWIAPTTIPGSKFNTLAYQRTPVGTPRDQGLVTKWSEKEHRGYGLFIDRQGSLALRIGDGTQARTVSTGTALRPWAPALGGQEQHFGGNINVRPMHVNHSGWYFVAATFDARTGAATVTQQPVASVPDDSAATTTKVLDTRGVRHSNRPLVMGAADLASAASARPSSLYNGKIEAPRIYDRALSSAELTRIAKGKKVATPVAAWDFSRQMSGDRVIDVGRRGLHGLAVNVPVRALTSHDWDTKTMSFPESPRQWGAMYFHEDDLGDARWTPSFTFTVPKNARSGVYAAKLQAGDKVYHATFVVRPKKAQSKIAMLVPTLSYLAYGGLGGSNLSQYSDHADGSGIVYSSALRPIENLRPLATGSKGEGRPWQFEADTHLFDWLETKGYAVDYITDHDLDREGRALLDQYSTVITGTHPEYISENEMNAFKGWLNNGGRMMYMGGNGFYWVTSLDKTRTYSELRRHDGTEAWQAAPGEYNHSTTGEYGGLWRFRGRPPQELVGVGFTAQGFGNSAGSAQYNRPFDRTEASYAPSVSWIFDGVTKKTGIGSDLPSLQSPGGPMGEEVDRADYALGTPANAVVVGRSQPFDDKYMYVVEEINTSSLFEGGTTNPLVRGDVTLMHYPKGGAVFSTASMVWSGQFFANGYKNDMTRITENVLDRFVGGRALPGAVATR